MRKYLIAVSAAALAVLAIPAASLAADSDAPNQPRRGGMLMQSDANADGVVTRQEFDAGRQAHFTQADANRDGSLSREEMRDARRAGREHMRGAHGQGERGQGERGRGEHGPGHRGMERADANNDGNITREEFLAGPTARFARMDANSDGVISVAERPQRRERGERPDIDADNNGQVSRAEFNAAGTAMFERLDANRDGRVTQDEANAARPQRPAQP